ncbi:MAG: T9SS type A sorting domain-containing protein [Bacteroidales bacterium]|nr:T9SS type A sorting domain-containing protein [Bacteroidales bacterium]
MKKKIYNSLLILSCMLFISVAYDTNAQDPYFVEMIQPNEAGIEVVIGSEYLISWTDNLSKAVHIKLSTDGGSTFPIVLAYNVEGSTWLWNTANTPGLTESTTCRILVKSVVDGSVRDYSENDFSLVTELDPSIRVLQPNETGIQWVLGDTRLISWTDNLSGKVGLELVDYSGASPSFSTIATNVEGSNYSWDIPLGLTAHEDYKIKIYSMDNTSVQDKSDNTFELSETGDGNIEVLQPDGDEIWDKGSNHLISWTDNLAGNVGIELVDYSSGSASFSTIATNVEGSTYEWEITDAYDEGDEYKIKIYAMADPSIQNKSDDYFEISQESNGFIQVLQPNDGEQWLRGTTKLISWTDNLSGKVGIELNDVTAGTFTNIATDIEGSTYSWDIPAGHAAHDNYKIKIYSMDDPANINDKSDNPFSILETMPGSITVLQPNVTGIKWAQGEEHLISWTDNLSGKVGIELNDVNAGTYTTIATDVEGSTYSWVIPDDQTAHDNYKIKIYSMDDPANINDKSDHNFEITGLPAGSFITVIQPNGGDVWEIGSTHLISWTDNLSGNVGIELVDYSQTPTSFTTIATNVTGNYSWTITSGTYDVGDEYKIKIYAMDDPTLQDKSDDYFELIPEMMLSVHPNPVNQSMTVGLEGLDASTYEVALYNQYNIAVETSRVNTAANKELIISTANLPNGIYFLMVKSGNDVITEKVVVQH